MFVRTYAGAIGGIDAAAVTVEVNIAGGGLGMYLVGLPDSAVKESEQRIRAAFENSGERMSGRKVVVSLAPADLRKEGASFDLPIAVGILAAMSRVNAETLAGTMFAGELSLDGTLKPVRVVRAREVQAARFAGTEGVHTTAMMNVAMLREYCRPDAASAALLERAMERLSLSARAYDRILKVARTIADLAGRETIAAADVAEAINYRSLDRGNWGR